MELQSGTLLQGGKYKIERVLGQGGFGITYLGQLFFIAVVYMLSTSSANDRGKEEYAETVPVETEMFSTAYLNNEQITVNGVSFDMVYVEGGDFSMGEKNGGPDEVPVHPVTLSSYYIGKTEVTQALWKAVMGNNPSNFKGDDLPVEDVSWDDCQVFIKKLNSLSDKIFRLPTEAEWEYAARGGNKNEPFRYCGSDNLKQVGWYEDNSGNKTHPVGKLAPNGLGLYDMSGNVWEWCSDWYDGYPSTKQTNPTGPTPDHFYFRVNRGDSWDRSARYCAVSDRFLFPPDGVCYDLGLRLVFVCSSK